MKEIRSLYTAKDALHMKIHTEVKKRTTYQNEVNLMKNISLENCSQVSSLSQCKKFCDHEKCPKMLTHLNYFEV